jgi:glycosyltransferase involved in cell wall biosynthesis
MGLSIVVAATGNPWSMLSCLEAIGTLAGSAAERELIIVDNASVGLGPILARLPPSVRVVRLPDRLGALSALRAGVAAAGHDVVVCLPEPAIPSPDALAALAAELPAAAAATSVDPTAARAHPAEARAIALRRDALPTLEVADAHAIAALCLELAARGPVVSCPAAHVTGTDPVRFRRGPGLEPIELSIVITTLDVAADELRACLRCLQATVGVAHEIIVVDNGAPPQGFSAPVNAALRAARGRRVAVICDDVEVLDGWWEPLAAALDAGERVVFPRTLATRPEDHHAELAEEFAAWCWAMDRTELAALGVAPGEFYDLDLLVWYQDIDLLQRLRRLGTPPRCVPESRVRHFGARTTEATAPRALKLWFHERRVQDQGRFWAKHPEARERWSERFPDRSDPRAVPWDVEVPLAPRTIALAADAPTWGSHAIPWPAGLEDFALAGTIAVEGDSPAIDLLAQFVFADEERGELFWIDLVPGVLHSGRQPFSVPRRRVRPIAGAGEPDWSRVRELVIRVRSRVRGLLGPAPPTSAPATLAVSELRVLATGSRDAAASPAAADAQRMPSGS